MSTMIKIIECPRDAMQGLPDFIPTQLKVKYLNALLKVGFDTIDFGSFVSPKAIPQMRDSAEVLSQLDLSKSSARLLAIVANLRGATDAAKFDDIDYLGYPFSVSETFQIRNTNATIEESLQRVAQIQEICQSHGKGLVLYLSMAFGNPFGDAWNVDIVQGWVDKLADMDIKIMALSDTVGVSTPHSISYLYSNLIPPYPDVEFGAHLHTTPDSWYPKVHAAYEHGCLRFDSAIRGYGGCPMAKHELTGNMATEHLFEFFDGKKIPLNLSRPAFEAAQDLAKEIFP
ncbi:MAG: hydroxymethylglutaryl-CoA lyase [Saprospiraceae bacterium]|nr:hydroxymethylglutaryl-CoA lyase [Saprospiraceae bacterium]